jgi:hypothetical protein
MSIHGSWEDLPPNMTGHCSDDAAMEAGGGKLAKGFSDREVAVDQGPDYDMTEENSLGRMQFTGYFR